jgi:hypothetical protein
MRSFGRGPADGLRDAQYRPDRPIAGGLRILPTCCAVSALLIYCHEAVNAQCRSVAYVGCQSVVATLLVDEAVRQTRGPDRPDIVGCVRDWRCYAISNRRALSVLAVVVRLAVSIEG